MRRLATWCCVVAVVAAACGADDQRIVVAAGTTLVDSGAMGAIVDAYVDAGADEIVVIGVSSQEALVLLEAGEADAAITHHPELEAAFADDHPELSLTPVFATRFVLAGPSDQVGNVAGMTLEAALAEIARSEMTFVSRDDGSGTAAKDREAWGAAGVDPSDQPWHVVTGSGMGPTLQIADQRRGFVITELSVLLAASDVNLSPVATEPGTVDLSNPYVLVFDPDDDRLAAFAIWLTLAGVDAVQDFATSEWGVDVFAPALERTG